MARATFPRSVAAPHLPTFRMAAVRGITGQTVTLHAHRAQHRIVCDLHRPQSPLPANRAKRQFRIPGRGGQARLHFGQSRLKCVHPVRRLAHPLPFIPSVEGTQHVLQ